MAADFKKWAEELYKRLSVRWVMDEAANVTLITAALAQVHAEERERCARVAENYCGIIGDNIAAAIRAQETSDAK